MFKALIRLFKKIFDHQIEEQVPEPHNPEPKLPDSKKIKKVAIIVGHSQKYQGAVSYTGEREWAYNNAIALKVRYFLNESDKEVKIFYRDSSKSYRSAMKDIAKRVSNWGADFSLELHFNSFTKKAYGCEILVAEDANNYEDTIRLADTWTDKLAKKFNLRQRHKVKFKDSTYGDGVKVCKVGERGYWNLAYLSDYGVPTSILIEPMFANIKHKESERFFTTNGKAEYASFLVEMIRGL